MMQLFSKPLVRFFLFVGLCMYALTSPGNTAPGCVTAGYYSKICLIEQIADTLGVDSSLIRYHDNGRFQIPLNLVPFQNRIFPKNEKMKFMLTHAAKSMTDDLLKEIADESTSLAASDIKPLFQHLTDLKNIYPQLIESGRYVSEHPLWNTSNYPIAIDLESREVTSRSDDVSNKQITYPLPVENWKPIGVLPDLLSHELDKVLTEMGFTAPSPLFIDYVPSPVATPIARLSLFRDSNEMLDTAHGMNTHQMQIISAYKTGVLSKALYDIILTEKLWGPFFDVDIFKSNTEFPVRFLPVEYDDHPQPHPLWFYHCDYITMRSPHMIHLNLLTGMFSRAIRDFLSTGDSHALELVKETLQTNDVDASVQNIQTLEHYTQYHHFQMLYALFQDFPDMKGGFQTFVREQYLTHGMVTFEHRHPIRLHAIKKAVGKYVESQDHSVFMISQPQNNDSPEATELESMEAFAKEQDRHRGFIVLQGIKSSLTNKPLLNYLRRLSEGKEPDEEVACASYTALYPICKLGQWLQSYLANIRKNQDKYYFDKE